MLPGRRSDNGSIFVIQGTPPAGTPLVAGIALSPLGAIYINGGQSAWSPIDLFQQNEEGAWYDPSDLSTMFQDAAGTTPVTAVGQPVGKILDKSGNGNHASQATSASRPVLRQDGASKYYLEFDGVDDYLSTSAVNFTATDKMSLFCGVMNTQNTTFNVICSNGNINSVAGSFQISSPLNGSDVWVGMNGSQLTANMFTGLTVLNTLQVYSSALNLRGTDFPATLRKNGVPKTGVSGGQPDAGTGNYRNASIAIGARGGDLSAKYTGRIYSLIVLGRLATAQEIDDTEAWVADKTGVTLP